MRSTRAENSGSFSGMCLNYKQEFGLSYTYTPDTIKHCDIKDKNSHVDSKKKSLLASLKVDSIIYLVCN